MLSVQDHTHAIRIDQKYTLVYVDRALSQTTLRDDDQAEADFRRAVDLRIGSSDLLRQEIDQRRSQR